MRNTFLFPLAVAAKPMPVRAPLPGGAPPTSGKVSVSIPHQQQQNWCWAAVSVGITTFYGSTTWTQGSVAQAELGLNCCAAPLPTSCDVPWYLDRALTRVQNFDHFVASAQSFTVVQAEINANRPLCCRIQWSIGGHFVAISGWSINATGVEFVDVEDPDNGYNFQTYTDFLTYYRSAGVWSDTYFTRATGAAGTGGSGSPAVTPTS